MRAALSWARLEESVLRRFLRLRRLTRGFFDVSLSSSFATLELELASHDVSRYRSMYRI